MEKGLPVNFGSTSLRLLPDHAVWSPELKTVWVADLHLGKEQAFRKAGMPIPDVLERDLDRLSRILDRTRTQKLMILGDLLHSRHGVSSVLATTVTKWRDTHPNVHMTLVRGNHDRHAGDPPSDWNLTCVDSPIMTGPFKLAHHPAFDDSAPTIAGHLHPKFRLRFGKEELKLPCFLVRQQTLVLPAFGSFIDHSLITPEADDAIYVVAGRDVIQATARLRTKLPH